MSFLKRWRSAAWRIVVFLVIGALLLAPLVVPIASSRADTPAMPAGQLYFDLAGLVTVMAAVGFTT